MAGAGRRPAPAGAADAAPGAVHPRHPLPWLVHAVGMVLLRMLTALAWNCRVRRAREVPAGACVYAANHRSFLDPPAIGMCAHRPLSFFARASLWRNPFFRLMLGLFSGIPVERENPGMSSMKGAVERLRQGIPVVVFPEGTRTKDGRLGPLREGPALFARRAGVPVVPVYLFRTERAWPRGSAFPVLRGGRIEIRFGRPLVAPAHLAPREADAWVMRRLAAWLAANERMLMGPRPGDKGG
jgi:1-acyl-sn-glycerol-3-phosphate acyltransferase